MRRIHVGSNGSLWGVVLARLHRERGKRKTFYVVTDLPANDWFQDRLIKIHVGYHPAYRDGTQ